ncbi:MAG TPA: choice-of-anchor J domain-containing protein, partial [Bacteroidales bacterium]|nr:choice-of-anchor J domain-containing protein [Bacteroidales bacterium]
GNDTISDIPLSLFVNGTEILSETMTDTILPYDTIDYAFNDSIDLTGMSGQDIDISIITNLASDEYNSNDSLTKQIRNVTCASLPYENDFSIADNFVGWLTEDANGDGNTWFLSQTNSEDLIYQGNENPADDWVFTQCLELEPNRMYKLSFDYASTGNYWPQSLEIHLGSYPESAGMTTLLDELTSIENSSLMTQDILFTTDETGHHYIGFRCSSDADMLNMIIDNVSITEQSGTDIALLEILSPHSSCNMDTESLSVLVRNQCSQTFTNVSIAFNLNGSITQENITEDLSPGEFYEYTFDEALQVSDFDTHNLQVSVSMPGDVDNTNDSLSLEFSNVQAAEIPWSVPFNSDTVLTHWLIDNANEDGFTWEYTNGAGNETSGALVYEYSSWDPADDWLITKCIHLETDMLYNLSFFTKIENASWPENLSVSLGSVQSAEAMQDTLINLPDMTYTNWTEVNTDFQVDETGIYYIGFHCYSDAQMFNLYLDDIFLDGESLVQIKKPEGLQAIIRPNPASNLLYLELNKAGNASITIFDLWGRAFIQKSLEQKRSRIIIQNLPAGMYMLEIQQDGKMLRKKFVKR